MVQDPLFYEVQGDHNLGLIVFLIIINIVMFFLVSRKRKRKDVAYLVGTGIGLVITLLATFLILTLKQYTQIKADGVYVKLFPIQIQYKYHSWESIQKSYIRVYNPISEYGGWGLKGSKRNSAVNQTGSDGLQLVFKDGNKLLIGTQKPEEIAAALKKINRYVK
ncbi:MAG: hypothetical protein WKF66_09730 [Pedobacter sp.]